MLNFLFLRNISDYVWLYEHITAPDRGLSFHNTCKSLEGTYFTDFLENCNRGFFSDSKKKNEWDLQVLL